MPSRRRGPLLAVLAAVAAVLAAAGAVLLVGGGDSGARVSDDPLLRPAAIVPETAAPAAPAARAASTDPPLPRPTPPPADPDEDVPIVAAGQLSIPRIGLVHTVYEGVWETVLDRGPGHWPGTAEPGAWGNAVYGGHRVTFSRPFRNLDRLEPGDEIVVRRDGVVHTYAVTENLVVPPTALWIVDQSPGRTITLFTCHPPGSAAERLVVRGELVSSLPSAG